MGLSSTTGLTFYPPQAACIALTAGAGTWVYGSWTPIIPNTSGATMLEGFSIGDATFSQAFFSIGVGIAPVGADAQSETSIADWCAYFPNSGNGIPSKIEIPDILSGIPSGYRVSARLGAAIGLAQLTFGFNHYTSFNGTIHATDYLTHYPLLASGVDITANTSDGGYSDWVLLFPGIGHQIGVRGIAPANPYDNCDAIYELGKVVEGEITKFTELTAANMLQDAGRTWYLYLTGVFPLDPDVAVYIRMRKSGTESGLSAVKLLYYDDIDLIPPVPPEGPPGCPITLSGGTVLAGAGCVPNI